jgi:SAM-dependent methyltransferase
MRGLVAAFLAGLVMPAGAQTPPLTGPTAEQLRIVEVEVPRLVALLRIAPGATIADVGAGLGAWGLRFARWTGPSGHVYLTDIGEDQLTIMRSVVKREGVANATVLVGAANATNLPAECCDAILLRNVYHYVTDPAAMNRSLAASLKPGGRLAIVDFPTRPNSPLPPGVPVNRGGNGIAPEIVEREVGAVLRHVTTVLDWAPGGRPPGLPKEVLPSYVVIFEKAK